MHASTSPAPALEVTGVTRTFPGVTALDDVSLEVRRGEVHGVVGENGAGKSTLMSVVSGALRPDAGDVRIGGEPLDPATPERARELGVAMVRQEPALLPDLSVAENMWLGQAPARRPPAGEMRAWARRQLERWSPTVGIDVSLRLDTLQPEHRFIVDIARAFAQDPEVLILDEPTEHLAGQDVERLFELIREHVGQSRAVVYISHRVHEVKAISDRISVLRDGVGRGTYDAADLDEQAIVKLIVGRSLDATFPDRPAPPAGEPRLVVRGLRAGIVSNVDLDVRPGEIVGLAGVEHNGQREALRALGGLLAGRGEVRVDGRRVRLGRPDASGRAGIAYLSGDRHREGLVHGLSVGENVALRNLSSISRLGLVSPARERALVGHAVADYDIKTPAADTPIESLSGGNQQKAMLAGVLSSDPSVLLIEEPTQGVDVGVKPEIYSILREMAASRGMAVVVTSSDALELAGLCDRVLVFSRGKVVRELVGEELREEEITAAALTATGTRERVQQSASKPLAWLAGDTAPLALIAVAVVGLGLYAAQENSLYLGERNFTPTLFLAATLVLLSMAQTTVLMTGGIDLSVGPLMGFLLVVESFWLTDVAPIGDWAVGWLLLVPIALGVGVLNWLLIEIVRLPALIATLATYIVLQALSLALRPTPGGIIDSEITEAIATTIGPIPVAFAIVCLLAVVMQALLTRTAWGLSLRASGSNEGFARVNGVSPAKVKLIAYVACSLLAGAGGVMLLSQVGSGDPTAGLTYTLASISAAVIGGASIFGGRGSYIGALAGAILVQQILSVTSFLNLNVAWQSYLLGGMTLVAVAVYSRSRLAARAG